MKNRFVSLLAVGALCVSMATLVGCGSDSSSSESADKEETTEAASEAESTEEAAADTEGDLLSQIQERGTIIVGTEGAWAPWTYHNEDDELVGFDVEVAKAVAEKLGVEAEFVEVDWDGIFAGIDAGRYDTTFNGVEITDEREEKYYFTTPYAYIHTALVVSGDNEDITSFEDLVGKTTANSINSTYMLLAESYGAEVTAVDDLAQTIDMLTSGRVDATLNADVSIYDYLNEKPDTNIKIVDFTDDASRVSAPVRKGEATDSLRTAMDQAIEELLNDGTISELSEKYFGSDITQN
ncbi:MAG: transporter substrate-binding domain-containing protein [Lachnospiraceae bacterium]|nr:transporter substrate-binding domain-containing protein [Lachnospiraceae bacterium]